MVDSINIRPATESDLESVLVIENALQEDRAGALEEGFLLSEGDQVEGYREYLSYRAFVVAELNSEIVGFLFALPPGSARMEKLKSTKDSFRLEDEYKDVFDLPNLAWMARIGVKSKFMRRGIARKLYSEILERFPYWNAMTTTVREPMFNRPSFELQKKFGFEVIGKLPMGSRGSLENIVCDVHFRAAV